jgi:hypothetical protein
MRNSHKEAQKAQKREMKMQVQWMFSPFIPTLSLSLATLSELRGEGGGGWSEGSDE